LTYAAGGRVKHEPVEGSSSIESLAYDQAKQSFEVKFKNGPVYTHHHVTFEEFERLRTAPRDFSTACSRASPALPEFLLLSGVGYAVGRRINNGRSFSRQRWRSS